MPRLEIDEQFAMHPKVVKSGNAAIGLWVRAGSWARNHPTDGVVPMAVALTMGTVVQVRKLIATGLWHDAGSDCITCPPTPADGVRFHDWHVFNRSTKEDRKRREQAAFRQAKWRERRRSEQNVDALRDALRNAGSNASTPDTVVRAGARPGTRVDSPVRSTGSHPPGVVSSGSTDRESHSARHADAGARERPGALATLVRALECSPAEARQVIDVLTTERKIRSVDAFVRKLVDDGSLDEFKRHLYRIREANKRQEIEAEDRRLRKGPTCPHGMMGGASVNGVTQKCRCGACDKIRMARELNGGTR